MNGKNGKDGKDGKNGKNGGSVNLERGLVGCVGSRVCLESVQGDVLAFLPVSVDQSRLEAPTIQYFTRTNTDKAGLIVGSDWWISENEQIIGYGRRTPITRCLGSQRSGNYVTRQG